MNSEIHNVSRMKIWPIRFGSFTKLAETCSRLLDPVSSVSGEGETQEHSILMRTARELERAPSERFWKKESASEPRRAEGDGVSVWS